MIGVSLPRLRMPSTSAGRSSKAVEVAMTSTSASASALADVADRPVPVRPGLLDRHLAAELLEPRS